MDVFTNLRPGESYLYHYTSAATLGKILDGGQLRLGPYSQTNDPRENQKLPLAIARSGQESQSAGANWKELNVEVDHAMRGRAKLACLTRDRPSAEDGVHYHRGWGRARMWDNYADRHRGACIVFNEPVLRCAIQDAAGEAQLHDGPVEYFSDWSAGVPDIMLWLKDLKSRDAIKVAADRVIARHWRELFFRKNDDWASECEYRFVVVDDRKELLADIRKALVAVAIGMDFARQDASVLRYRLNRIGLPKLPVAQVKWPGGRPEATPAELIHPPTPKVP